MARSLHSSLHFPAPADPEVATPAIARGGDDNDATPTGSSGSDTELDSTTSRFGVRRFGERKLGVAACFIGLTALVSVIVAWPRERELTEAEVEDLQSKSLMALAIAAAEEVSKVEDLQKESTWAKDDAESLGSMMLGAHTYNKTKLKLYREKYNSTNLDKLYSKFMKGTYNKTDGNVCADDEEIHGGLCYKKCELLTEGQYKHRTSAFACCAEQPCRFWNSKFKPLSFCAGFDIAGDSLGNGCPHLPGGCLGNEEYFMGACMMKCTWLTQGVYPFRVGAATCCKVKSILACMEVGVSNTSVSFAVGGGSRDDDPSTPDHPHPIMRDITEDRTA